MQHLSHHLSPRVCWQELQRWLLLRRNTWVTTKIRGKAGPGEHLCEETQLLEERRRNCGQPDGQEHPLLSREQNGGTQHQWMRSKEENLAN